MTRREPGYHDFHLYLQDELERRCSTNHKYSLRAFAKSLGLESSALSKILNRKRAITPTMFDRLAERLGLDPETRRDLEPHTQLKPQRQQLSVDQFKIIARWYHFAILELTNHKNFSDDPTWLAQQLGISVSEVNFALDRLERAGMLAKEDGVYKKCGHYTTINGVDTSTALRQLQATILDQAKVALQEIPIADRDSSSITIASTKARISRAKKMIAGFRQELATYLAAESNADAVYQLSIQLFPATPIEDEIHGH